MSKHRHSKDRMFVTYSQVREQKLAKDSRRAPFQNLPFYCCSLSLAPFQDPVCTKQGHVFDILYIMPFIKKYQRNPVTGKPLKANELIKMHWTKSQNPNSVHEYQDPISYKIFTQSTHIVCIATSGFVYAYDTVLELNKKNKNYLDLMTNQPFTIQDIINIQDPRDQKMRQLQSFDYIKNNLPFVPPQKLAPQVNQTDTITRVMEQIDSGKQIKKAQEQVQLQKKKKRREQLQSRQDVKGFIQWAIQNKVYKHQRQTDFSSASTTSTSYTPNYKASLNLRELKASEIRDKIYQEVKKCKGKGYVQIVTNLGTMNFIVHCDLVPRTGQNFMQLSQNKYYDNTKFHRLVKNFCLQGGDPTGTGSGGQSIFGLDFQDQFHNRLSHNKTGMLSMANSGPHSNKSQFFITLAECKHLDNKHTVFGEIVSQDDILHKINREYTSKSQKPKNQITISKIICVQNPYRKAIKKLKQQYEQGTKDRQQQKKQKQKQRWIQDSGKNGKFQLPFKSQQQKLLLNKNMSLGDRLLQDYL